MKANQLKAGSILSYVQMGIGMIVQLVYTPVMIRLLGQSEYGLYNTVASTISVLSLLSLGFNSGYIRYYAIYKKENNQTAISKLNGLFLIVFSIIGAVALACGLFLTFNLELVFRSGLTFEEYKTARVLMLLLTVNLSLSFPMSVFANIISAHENFVFLKLVGMIKTVFGPLITLPLLLAGFRSIAMVSVTVLLNLVADICYLYFVLFRLKEKFIFRSFEKGIFKELFTYTVFIAMNMIIDQINWNIDKLLLGRFKGTSEVAVYSVGYTLYNCYHLFSTSISNVFAPRIHKIVNATKDNLSKQREELTGLFTRVGRIQFLVLGLIASGVIFFGYYFIVNIWADENYANAYKVALLLILPSSIALIENLGIEIQRAENKHRFRSIAYFFMALINLVLSVILCQKYGAVGSAVGTAISLVVANGIVMNIYYHKKCNIDILYFIKNIARLFAGLIIPVAFGVLLMKLGFVKSFVTFIAGVAAYTAVYCCSVWFLAMNSYEKELILVPVRKMLKKSVKK